MIILDTRLDLIRRSPQELSSFETDPDFDHGEVTLACALKERRTAALGAELAKDGKSAGGSVSYVNARCGWEDQGLPFEEVKVGVQASADTFE